MECNAQQTQTLESWLESVDGVVSLSFRDGDVLVYTGHLANGLYLVASGEVALYAHGDGTRPGRVGLRSAADGPFLLPPPTALDQPAQVTVAAASPCRVIFVPRSVLLLQSAVADRLNTLTEQTQPLVAPPATQDQRYQ